MLVMSAFRRLRQEDPELVANLGLHSKILSQNQTKKKKSKA
jgi:hypothetical protein